LWEAATLTEPIDSPLVGLYSTRLCVKKVV